MKKIFIHAGPGKTGTSAIQHWLSRNVDLLAENGIHYPYHDVDSNGVSPGNYDAVLSQDENDKWIVDADKTNSLIHRFNASECHTLLLSSEIFIGQIENLLSLMPNAKVILYFRNPIEVMESNYNQLVKRHRHNSVLKPNNNSLLPAINRFSILIEKFGTETIIIKPYLKGIKKTFDITSDFLKTIEYEAKIDAKSKIINTSYPKDLLEFKRILNFFPIDEIDHQCDVILQKMTNKKTMEKKEKILRPSKPNKFLINKLNSFSSKYNLPQVRILIPHIAKQEIEDHYNYPLTVSETVRILDAIDEEDHLVLKKIDFIIRGDSKSTNKQECAEKLLGQNIKMYKPKIT